VHELTASAFEIVSCQAVLFTPDADLSVTKAIKAFYPDVSDRFDDAPTVLPPVPEGSPIEVPRIILDSSSHDWRCELSPARASVIWRRTSLASIGMSLAEFFQISLDVLLRYTTTLLPRVGRLATVITRFAAHNEPGLFLARHFCKERWDQAPLNRPANFELHAHKRYRFLDCCDINSWARNKSGTLAQEPAPKPVVLFEQDMNTLAEQASERAFTEAEMRRFFEAIGQELESVLALYYPEN
jgi:hypothetical protein